MSEQYPPPPGPPSPDQPQQPYPTGQPYPQYPGTQNPPPYQQYGFPAAPRNGLGTAALVLGIVGIFPLAGFFVPNILGIVFGIIGNGRVKRGEATNGGQAIAGIVLGAVGILLSVFVIIYIVHNINDCGQARCDT